MEKIYRLEARPGYGVYTAYGAIKEISDVVSDCRRLMERHFEGYLSGPKHPGPYSDTLLRYNFEIARYDCDNVFYGFSSMDQLRAWFYSDDLLKEFDKIGVTLVCYEVDILIKGNAQAAAPITEKKPESVKWRLTLKEFLEKGLIEKK
jgi:hypothetical protein